MHVFKGITLIGGINYDSNIYLIDGELIIDAGSGKFFAETREDIENSGYDLDKIKTLINTHCHFDHTGGDKKLRDWLGLKIGVHKNDVEALTTGIGTLAERFGESSRSITTDKLLKDGDIINTTHFDFTVIETPGHTPGSICLLEKNKGILISGDTLFADSRGRTDIPGADTQQLMDSLKKLLSINANYLLPGHGQPKMGGVSFLVKQILAREQHAVAMQK
ncbi:MAG: MBL fold metallo-hydrolase [Candidatus Aenigmatarchaeota archaeon]